MRSFLLITLIFSLNACQTTKEIKADRKTVREVELNKVPAWRSEKPKSGQKKTLVWPKMQKVVLANGLELRLYETKDLPIVSVGLVFKLTDARETYANAGINTLLANMLPESQKDMQLKAFTKEWKKLGTSVGVHASKDSFYIGSGWLKNYNDRAFELLSKVVLNYKFKHHNLKQLKVRQLQNLEQNKSDSDYLARQAFAKYLYGEQFYYSFSSMGTKKSLKKINIRALNKQANVLFNPHQAALVVAGDISMEELKSYAEKYFLAWKGSSKVRLVRILKTENQHHQGEIILVQSNKKASQTSILMGRPLLQFNDREKALKTLMVSTFGGHFSAPLNMSLREEKGWSYGAFAYLSAGFYEAPLNIATKVIKKETVNSVKEIIKLLQAMQKSQYSEELVNLSKTSIITRLENLVSSTGNLEGLAKNTFLKEYSEDYFPEYLKDIKAVDKAAMSSQSQSIYEPTDMTIVLVGDVLPFKEELSKIDGFTVVVETE